MQKFAHKRPPMTSTGAGGRLSYFLARAIVNMRQNPLVNLVTIGTITLALLIVSLFLLVFVNLENAAESWSEKVQVTIYFDQELTQQQQTDLKTGLWRFRRQRGSIGLAVKMRSNVSRNVCGDRKRCWMASGLKSCLLLLK